MHERDKWPKIVRIVVRMLLVRRVACYLTPVEGRGRRRGVRADRCYSIRPVNSLRCLVARPNDLNWDCQTRQSPNR